MTSHAHVGVGDQLTSTFLGMDNRVLLGVGQTDGQLGVIDVSIRPGAGAPPHTNTREAIMWFGIDGTLVLSSEDGQQALAAGDAVFFRKGGTHSFMNMSDRPARALLVCLPGGFEEFLLELSGKLPVDVPSGPPSAEVIETLATVAAQYDMAIQTPPSL